MDKGRRYNIQFTDKKFVFMMLKKCASVTMGMTMLKCLGHIDLTGNNIDRTLGTMPHPNRYEVDALEDYTKIAWVRNPFNRLVSGWYDRIKCVSYKSVMDWYEIPNTISFSDFVDWVCSIEDSEMNSHFRQQTSDITIDGRLVPNVIMKLETLTADWNRLKEKHDWLVEMTIHSNKSKKGKYSDYYTSKMIDKVMIRFKDDFDLLNYGGING